MGSNLKNSGLPGFAIDPVTGRYYPVPVDFAVQIMKFRKMESGARKELLIPPSKKNEKAKDISTKDTKNRNSGVRNSLLPFKNDVRRPVSKVKKSEMDEYLHVIPITEDSFKSNSNFLKPEEQCQSPMDVDSSPVSSVCNVFENKMLLNSEGKNTNKSVNQKEIMLEIRRTISVNRELYQETSSKIKEILGLQVRQEENFRKIENLTDKCVPVPVDFGALYSDNRTKRLYQEGSSYRRSNDVYSVQPMKFRKMESGARKELLIPPSEKNEKAKDFSTKDTKNRNSGVRNSLLKSLPSSNNDVRRPVSEIKITAESDENEIKTPDSFESTSNFLKPEEQCQSPMHVDLNESPVSSVCNVFENKMLLNSEGKNTNKSVNQKEIMIIDKLDDGQGNSSTTGTDEAKENSAIKKRSLRLQNKSPVKNINRPAGSPGILKSGDLRKSTLTKSLVTKCQKYQIDSPRVQKAIDMYNSTRSACNVLLTPKISRGELVTSPKSSNWRSNLSRKVQQQCWLLRDDTPVHK